MNGKSVVAVVLGLQIGFSAFLSAGASAHDITASPPAPASLMVNGQLTHLVKEPILIQEKTYISAQDAAMILQAEWVLEGKTGTLQIGDSRSLGFQLDTGKVAVNGEWQEHGEQALTDGQDIYLPLRWIVEQAGHEIAWNEQEHRVQITTTLKEGGLTLLETDQLTADEQKFVESVKKTRGIHQQGDVFVIARGESPNPGYGLKVTATQWTWEQLIVYVKQTSPEPDKMYSQVITYPVIVAKAELPPYTTVVFLDADTKKELFAQKSTPQ